MTSVQHRYCYSQYYPKPKARVKGGELMRVESILLNLFLHEDMKKKKKRFS